MMKILMAEYQPWQHRIEDGEHKYARFFLEEGHQVFWVANFFNVNRLIRRREDDLAYLALWRQGVQHPLPGLTTFTPFAWVPYAKAPVLGSEWVGLHSLKWTSPSLHRTLVRQGFDKVDVLWIGQPRLFSLNSLLKYRVMVYRMSDDVEHFDTEPYSIGQIEQRLCAQTDMVFATARQLVDKAQRYASCVHYLPNGVDYELFNAPNLPIPQDLEQIPQPRLIYVGQIGPWFDFDLLLSAADKLSNCSIVLIGPRIGGERERANLEQLGKFSNVYVLGSRPFAQVSAYMQHSQVGLIPFVRNSMTHAISPIKLFEYCSAGLPVVSARLQETERLGSPALWYETADEFVASVQKALQNQSALSISGREFGKANTWRQRYGDVIKQVNALLDNSHRSL